MKMNRKEYQCPSIQVIEVEVQLPIATSYVTGVQTTPWESELGDGAIEDN